MIGATLQNRYRIDAELGQGGMGVVYRAQDLLLNRSVAVKVLSAAELGTTGKPRLLAEAQAAAKLNHPNIVNVYDAGEADGQPFIVMELVQGETLRAYRPATLAETLQLARQMCAALDHAHANGVIHRDLKPENIVLTPSQTVKLMDFGLARASDSSRRTEEGALVGTLSYLAPEIIQGQPASVRSDLYALGVMLYELVAACPPFNGETFLAVVSQHLYAPVTPPSAHNPEIPDWLDDLILRLLSKQPAERPAAAAEVLEILAARRSEERRRGAPLPPNNLPTHLNRFIGREKEIAQIKDRLAENHLVTLTGSGGVGKTRLAIQAAQELLPEYPNGVWLVELAPLTDAALLVQAVGAALGILFETGRPLLATLTDYLRERTLLLVLDNCEHLIDACAQLAEHLLQHCPAMRLLASSREALGIEGETAFRVPSLSLLDIEAGPFGQPASIPALASESVQLFVERATDALPDFSFTTANAPVIAQVCRRLDGIALAIELAAARVKVLEVEQIAARLDNAFRLLTGGSRTALPRQQTLRATIDWSYNLLPEIERSLLRRLAVFAGGWYLEAAEAVCAGNGIDEYEVLDLLTQLVNKSLVVVEHEQSEAVRYRLLETVRQYAREKLFATGEGELARQRQLKYFLGLAERARVELTGPKQVAWIKRLEAELDNIRAALEWALESDIQAGLRLAGALRRYWGAHSPPGDGIDWLLQLLSHPAAAARTPARAQALAALASLNVWEEFMQAQALAEEALKLYEEFADSAGAAFALFVLGQTRCLHQSYSAGSDLIADSLARYRRLGDKVMVADILGALGELLITDDTAQARACLEESLALCRELDYPGGLSRRLLYLGVLASEQKDYASARAWMEEALALQRNLNKSGAAQCLFLLGELSLRQGIYDQACVYLEEGMSLMRESGRTGGLWPLSRLGYAFLRQGDWIRARGVFVECQQGFKAVGAEIGVVYSLEGLASLSAAQSQPERAVRLFAWADAVRETINNPRPAIEQAEVDRDFASIRTQLAEAAIEAARAMGRALTMEQAMAEAMET